MTIDELNEFMYKHGFCNTNNEEDVPKKYVADLVEDALKEGYVKGIEDFYDRVLNFEDYILPLKVKNEYSYYMQLYHGRDISDMIVKIKNELLRKIKI